MTQNTKLSEIVLSGCGKITDTSVLDIATHCSGLSILALNGCRKITDCSMSTIATHCTMLTGKVFLFFELQLKNLRLLGLETVLSHSF